MDTCSVPATAEHNAAPHVGRLVSKPGNSPNVKILVCYHKPAEEISSDIFVPIHVGRSRADATRREELDFCIGDDTGQNISEKNANYCELTALYWAWKNLPRDVDYVGLCHYRRLFDFDSSWSEMVCKPEGEVSRHASQSEAIDRRIVSLCQKNDLIVPKKQRIDKGWIYDLNEIYDATDDDQLRQLEKHGDHVSVFDHYAYCHIEEDFRLAIQVLLEKHPEYLDSIDTSIRDNHCRFCNMFVMRRELFDEYMEFLFGILEEVEDRLPETHPIWSAPGSFDSRALGMLGERLFSIFVDHAMASTPSLKKAEYPILLYSDRYSVEAPVATPAPDKQEPIEIDIFFASDENYAEAMATAIASILINAGEGERHRIHVLDGGIAETTKHRLRQLKHIRDFYLEFTRVDSKEFSQYFSHQEEHYSVGAANFRMAIPALFPRLDRAVYLDCDVIITKSLRELWCFELGDCSLAAVEDPFNFASDVHKYQIGLDHTDRYFNSGVLLLDMKRWRRDKADVACLKAAAGALNTHNLVFPDQDALNIAMRGKTAYLPPEWNVQLASFVSTSHAMRYSWTEMENGRTTPAIIHYTGDIKPWQPGCTHPFRDKYFEYRDRIPWPKAKRPPAFESFRKGVSRRLHAGLANFLLRDFWMSGPLRRMIYAALYDPSVGNSIHRLKQLNIVRWLLFAIQSVLRIGCEAILIVPLLTMLAFRTCRLMLRFIYLSFNYLAGRS